MSDATKISIKDALTKRKKGINSARYIPYSSCGKHQDHHLKSGQDKKFWVIRKANKRSHSPSILSLQINQASTALLLLLLTLLPRSRAERVVALARAETCLRRELRRRHAGILALQRLLLSTEEWVVASLCSFKTTH
jgi:hypothetical protein